MGKQRLIGSFALMEDAGIAYQDVKKMLAEKSQGTVLYTEGDAADHFDSVVLESIKPKSTGIWLFIKLFKFLESKLRTFKTHRNIFKHRLSVKRYQDDTVNITKVNNVSRGHIEWLYVAFVPQLSWSR